MFRDCGCLNNFYLYKSEYNFSFFRDFDFTKFQNIKITLSTFHLSFNAFDSPSLAV